MVRDMGQVVADLHFWQEMLRAAGRVYAELPPYVRRELERSDGDAELSRMVPVLATFSAHARQRMEDLLGDVLVLLQEVTPGAGGLHLVDEVDEVTDPPEKPAPQLLDPQQ